MHVSKHSINRDWQIEELPVWFIFSFCSVQLWHKNIQVLPGFVIESFLIGLNVALFHLEIDTDSVLVVIDVDILLSASIHS